MGTNAEIIEANKLRSGGIGGFFAKESFEVVVDFDDDDLPPAPSAQAPTAPAIDDDEGDAEEPFEALTLLQLADKVSDDEEAATFQAALAGALADRAAAATGAAPTEATAAREGGHGEIDGEIERSVRGGHAGRADDGEDTDDDDDDVFVIEPLPVLAASRPAAAEAAAEWPAETAIAAAEPVARPLAGPRYEPGLLAAPRLAAPPTSRVPAVPTPGQRERALDLRRIGMPEHLLATTRGSETDAAELLRLLEALPVAPGHPQGKGTVIAVAGERDEALELAAELAADLGTPSSEILLASTTYRGRAIGADRRLADPCDADAARRSWRRRNRPTLVVVEAPIRRDRWDALWATAMLDALEPSMLWGTVGADRKPDDVAAWAEALGGVDALGVIGLDATASPASVLQTGIPVGRIDGADATPARWAALLTERLAAAA